MLRFLIRRVLEEAASVQQAIRYSDGGNRAVIRLNHSAYLQDPHLLRFFTEYQATGNFTGHLRELSPADAEQVKDLQGNLRFLREEKIKRGYGAGAMWARFDEEMISNIEKADPRIFNHAGALNYKTFSPQTLSLESVIEEVLRTLVLYDHLRERVKSFEGLFTGLNSRYFTLDGHRLNADLRAVEEKLILLPALEAVRQASRPLRVLEIGAGGAQLAALLLSEGARMVILDLPGMHARGPYRLYKEAGAKICTYQRYLELGRDLDRILDQYHVVYLPPWEKESIGISFDLAVNVHSLGEMEVPEVMEYLRLIGKTCRSFFSINTSTRGLDRKAQPEYQENSSLSYGKTLGMDLMDSGTPLFDSIFQKTIHYSYAVYRARGASQGGSWTRP